MGSEEPFKMSQALSCDRELKDPPEKRVSTNFTTRGVLIAHSSRIILVRSDGLPQKDSFQNPSSHSRKPTCSQSCGAPNHHPLSKPKLPLSSTTAQQPLHRPLNAPATPSQCLYIPFKLIEPHIIQLPQLLRISLFRRPIIGWSRRLHRPGIEERTKGIGVATRSDIGVGAVIARCRTLSSELVYEGERLHHSRH